MKNQIVIILCALTLTAFVACEKNTPDPRSQTGSKALVSYNECVEFTDYGYTICYEDVNEYRCPCNAECFWEGAVDVALHVTGPQLDTVVNLTTNSNPINLTDSAQIGEFTLKISDPLPYDCNDFNSLDTYKVTVEFL